MAYQIAFDLYESATQQFLGRVLQALRATAPIPTLVVGTVAAAATAAAAAAGVSAATTTTTDTPASPDPESQTATPTSPATAPIAAAATTPAVATTLTSGEREKKLESLVRFIFLKSYLIYKELYLLL